MGRTLRIVKGAAVTVTGRQLLALAQDRRIEAITRDRPLRGTAYTSYDANQWFRTAQIDGLVNGPGSVKNAPTIAVIDSDVDATRVQDFGGRIVKQVNLSSLDPRGSGDAFGHGTMVAELAAGAS